MLVSLLAVAELTPQLPRLVEVGGRQLLVVKTEAGVSVVSAVCPHRGAPLVEGFVVEGVIVCPWHRSMFDLETGAPLGGPCGQPLAVFSPVERDGIIYIESESV